MFIATVGEVESSTVVNIHASGSYFKINDFKRYAEMYKQNMKESFDLPGWNDFWKSEFGLFSQQLSNKQIAWLGTLNSDKSRDRAVEYWLNPTAGNLLSAEFTEIWSQWKNPMLVFSGLSAGLLGWEGIMTSGISDGAGVVAREGTTQYTKSNLRLGQEMHKAYHVREVGKEYILPSGRRIDFLDINNRTINELKPFNPRSIKQGEKQLQLYRQEIQTVPEFRGYNWKVNLDFY